MLLERRQNIEPAKNTKNGHRSTATSGGDSGGLGFKSPRLVVPCKILVVLVILKKMK